MKGIVFTEFLEMVEEEFGYDVVDQIIVESNLSSNGEYTSIGTYEFGEMLQLLTSLSSLTKIEIPVLIKSFGKYLFHTFLGAYPKFFERCDNSFTFLQSIDGHIHKEVKKLYTDAELPKFETEVVSDKELNMVYSSSRKLGDLAEGLIEETMKHFKNKYSLLKTPLNSDNSMVKFTIRIDG